MTAILNKKLKKTTLPRVCYRHTGTDRSYDRILDRRHVAQIAAEEEEAATVAKYTLALPLLGITPLIVFLFMHYFFPDLLLLLDPPTS